MRQLLLCISMLMISLIVFSQSPSGFNYQAAVRDSEGNVLIEQNVSFRISILQGSVTGTSVYSEEHDATTNTLGLVNLKIGNGSVLSGDINTIDWTSGSYFLKVELDPEGGTNYAEMGTSQLMAVPFAMHANTVSNAEDADADPANEIQDLALSGNILTITKNGSATQVDLSSYLDNTDTQSLEYKNDSLRISNGNAVVLPYDSSLWKTFEGNTFRLKGNVGIGTTTPRSKLEVKGDSLSTEQDTLFSVKDKNGNVVFAVFPDGAKVYVDNTTKGTVGGFAVSGRSATKAAEYDLMKVTLDSTRIYVPDSVSAKGKVGGFAVSGRSATKLNDENYLYVTPTNTQVTVNQDAKGTVGGFAVSGRSASKGIVENILFSNPDSTRIFTKDAVGGFGVRDNSSGSAKSYLQLSPQNYFIGHNSGINNSSGYYNLFLGYESGKWNNTGGSNVFIGPYAGSKNSKGFGNIFIGNRAGYHNSDIDSVSPTESEGYYNVYIGYNSGENIIRGRYNTFLGYATCTFGVTGEFNTYIGNQAGNQSNGSSNVFLGVKAGELAREGSNNVMLGNFAGQRCYSGSSNVFVGYYAGYGEDSSNKLFIENSSSNYPLIWGDFLNDQVVIDGNGANNANSRTFFVNGTAGGASSWYNDSDRRMKANISTIQNPLAKVMKLRGVNFEWKDTEKRGEGTQIGFIAQEAENIIPEVVDKGNDNYSMQYAPITAVLVEAMKEQQKMIEKQNQLIKELQQKVDELEKK